MFVALDTHAGHKSITLEIEGKGAEQLVNESGGQRIQRVPPTERRGRVHSSTVTVAVLEPGQVQLASCLRRAPDDYVIEWFNGTIGAGGQNHQKTQSCARLTHVPTGLVKTAQTRSRQNSLKLAMAAINVELDRMMTSYAQQHDNARRREQIGSGERSDKRRTIRFQHDEVVDHITGKRLSAKDYMRGGMDRLW